MSATFLVLLLCGQPVFVFLDTPTDSSLYAIGEMEPERRKAFMETVDAVVAEGRAKRLDFKVEEQTAEKVCGIST